MTASGSDHLARTDLDLLRQIQAGQEEAFNVLFQRYQGLIGNKAQQFYASFQEQIDLEELRQEAGIAFLIAARRFDLEKGDVFAAFAERTVSNRLQDLLRRHWAVKRGKADQPLSLEALCEAGLDHPSKEVALDLCYILREEAKGLKRFMEERLSPRERAVFEMQMAGASYRLMAEVLHCSRKSVDAALQRGRKKLQAFWEGRL